MAGPGGQTIGRGRTGRGTDEGRRYVQPRCPWLDMTPPSASRTVWKRRCPSGRPRRRAGQTCRRGSGAASPIDPP